MNISKKKNLDQKLAIEICLVDKLLELDVNYTESKSISELLQDLEAQNTIEILLKPIFSNKVI